MLSEVIDTTVRQHTLLRPLVGQSGRPDIYGTGRIDVLIFRGPWSDMWMYFACPHSRIERCAWKVAGFHVQRKEYLVPIMRACTEFSSSLTRPSVEISWSLCCLLRLSLSGW